MNLNEIDDGKLRRYLAGELSLANLRRRMTGAEPYEIRAGRVVPLSERVTFEDYVEWRKCHECQFQEGDMRWMLKLLEAPRVYVEIGSWHGCSLVGVASEMPPGSVMVSVDLPYKPGNTEVLSETVEWLRMKGMDVFQFTADSNDPSTAVRVLEILGGRKVEFLFIDGGHDYEVVKRDWEIWSQLVPDNMPIGFHDVRSFRGPRRPWKELLAG
jgi:hypothetical protein